MEEEVKFTTIKIGALENLYKIGSRLKDIDGMYSWEDEVKNVEFALKNHIPDTMTPKETTDLDNLNKSIQSLSNELLKKQHEVMALRAANIGKDQEIENLNRLLIEAHEEYARARNSEKDYIKKTLDMLKCDEHSKDVKCKRCNDKGFYFSCDEPDSILNECDCCSDFPDNAGYDFVSPCEEDS